jgi:hypothetical protein
MPRVLPAGPTLSGDPARIRRRVPIVEKRNKSLHRMAVRLVHDGVQGAALRTALLEANLRLCQPPLSVTEVTKIVRSVSQSPRR